MARVENTTHGQRDITALVGPVDDKGKKTPVTFSVPRGSLVPGDKTNGFAEIDDEFLAEAKKDAVVKAWFDSGDLVVKTSRETAADHRAAQADQSTHDKGSKR